MSQSFYSNDMFEVCYSSSPAVMLRVHLFFAVYTVAHPDQLGVRVRRMTWGIALQ